MKELSTRGKLVVVLLSLSTMFGCGALEANQPGVQSSTGLIATSPVLNFGTVPVGTTGVLTNTIVNNTQSPITLTRAQVDHADFQITSPKLPLTLAAGQRTALQIAYSPQSSGSSQGRVVLTSNVTRFTSTFTMKGTATISSRIRLDPASISFGNVQTGKTQTQAATLTNSGRMAVTITRIAVSGTEFALSGLTLPMTLQGGQSAPVSVNFTPRFKRCRPRHHFFNRYNFDEPSETAADSVWRTRQPDRRRVNHLANSPQCAGFRHRDGRLANLWFRPRVLLWAKLELVPARPYRQPLSTPAA